MSSLSVSNLSCQRGYHSLFSHLSFQVNAGDVLRITGTNGSGKTSLLKILAGLNAAEKGTINWGQYRVKTDEYQREIFYLGHLSALSTDLTSVENLAYLNALNQTTQPNSPLQALHSIGLSGYEEETCANLSAGQKRRVILAGLFSSNAKIWLLDEPFTALDPAGIKLVESTISQHCQKGGLCLFTTHQDSALPNQTVLAL